MHRMKIGLIAAIVLLAMTVGLYAVVTRELKESVVQDLDLAVSRAQRIHGDVARLEAMEFEILGPLRVSVGTVYRAIRRGEIRAVKPTGRKHDAPCMPPASWRGCSRRRRRIDYAEGAGSAGTSTALNRAPRHETESTPSRLISSSLQPNMRT